MKMVSAVRHDGRSASALRPVTITAGVHPYAEGSAEVAFGGTRVLVTASVELSRPKWKQEGEGGWITAEYGMLPRATHTRNSREAASGKQGGRTLEIQRLIGRALRAATNVSLLENITIRLDCDVLVADGGTRTAAISGGWVALMQALDWVETRQSVAEPLPRNPVAAVSLGAIEGELLLDLCYEEDSSADFDVNVVLNGDFDLIEIQGTAENGVIPRAKLDAVLALAASGCEQIFKVQADALAALRER